MIEIFCPNCDELILDQATCPACGWRRPVEGEGIGAEVWCADLGTRLNKPHCYPVVADGFYCLGTEDGTLLALDLGSGEVAWEQSLGEKRMAHALATDGERLFVGCEDTHSIPVPGKSLLASDARTGQEVWQVPTEAHSLSAAAVAAGNVYFTTSNGWLHAVDAATGQKRWAVEHPVWGPAPPAVGEGVVCAGGRGETLVAYATADGAELWRFSADGWFAAPLLIGAGCVYALCWDDHLYVLDAHTGRLMWRYKGERGKGLTTPPAVTGGRVFVGSRVYRQVEGEQTGGYAMLALSAQDGAEIWRCYTERHIFTPPAVADDALFFGSNDGLFYTVDAASGEERWRAQVKSRAVTQPRVAGDVVIFGGRDGMVHAVRWRARPREKLLAPSTYKRRGEYTNAAVAHALRGEFDKAATIYEERLGKHQEAAWLYERADQPGKAASLWERLGELKRARDLYREAGDNSGLAGVLEQMGESLQAARLYEELGDLDKAVLLYDQAGDRPKAAALYRRLGRLGKALTIWVSLDQWEKAAEALVAEGKPAEAADILAQHDQLERAADLYEQAGRLQKALSLKTELGHWESVAGLAFRVGDYEQEAQARERLEHHQPAAEAYVRSAQQALDAKPVDEGRVAILYEHAARLYGEVFEEERASTCRRMVRRYRHLPEVEVRVVAEGVFVEYEYNTLQLEVANRGYGVARDIDIQLRGEFDVTGDCCIRGLAPQGTKSLEVSVRPHKEHYGPKVPLEIAVTYEDRHGSSYPFSHHVYVSVNQQGILAGLSETPLQINIQELYQPGAKKVGGDEIQAGAQIGDRVDIRRGGGGGLTLESGETGNRVQIRRGGPVRRCPNPRCNVPVNDPEGRYCSECGAPLDEERND